MRRASFLGAWSPGGIDVKRRRSAAYRRLTRTLLHTPFLPRPFLLPFTQARALYKRRAPEVSQRRDFSTMESPRLRLLPFLGAALLLLCLLGTRAQEDAELQPRALDVYSAVEDASHEKELVGISLAPEPLGCRAVLPLYASLLSLPPSPLPFPVRARGDESKAQAPAAILRPSRAHRLQAVCRAKPLSRPLGARVLEAEGPAVTVTRTALAKFPPLEHPFLSAESQGGVRVFLGLLITRAGSEHLGWARSQGGSLRLRGRCVADRSATGSPEEAQE